MNPIFSSSVKNKLERHMFTHEYKCVACSINFNNYGELRKHNSQEHTGKDKKTCPICMVSQVNYRITRLFYLGYVINYIKD